MPSMCIMIRFFPRKSSPVLAHTSRLMSSKCTPQYMKNVALDLADKATNSQSSVLSVSPGKVSLSVAGKFEVCALHEEEVISDSLYYAREKNEISAKCSEDDPFSLGFSANQKICGYHESMIFYANNNNYAEYDKYGAKADASIDYQGTVLVGGGVEMNVQEVSKKSTHVKDWAYHKITESKFSENIGVNVTVVDKSIELPLEICSKKVIEDKQTGLVCQKCTTTEQTKVCGIVTDEVITETTSSVADHIVAGVCGAGKGVIVSVAAAHMKAKKENKRLDIDDYLPVIGRSALWKGVFFCFCSIISDIFGNV